MNRILYLITTLSLLFCSSVHAIDWPVMLNAPPAKTWVSFADARQPEGPTRRIYYYRNVDGNKIDLVRKSTDKNKIFNYQLYFFVTERIDRSDGSNVREIEFDHALLEALTLMDLDTSFNFETRHIIKGEHSATYDNHLRVVRSEILTTPLGTYDTVLLEWAYTPTFSISKNTLKRGVTRYWYAPELRTFIKRHYSIERNDKNSESSYIATEIGHSRLDEFEN